MRKLLTTHGSTVLSSPSKDHSLLTKNGFNVIELLIVTAMIATFSVVLVLNFRSSPKNQVARSQTAAIIVSDIRRAQTMALAGTRFQGNTVCGYGIHYINSKSYILYAGVLGGAIKCQDTDHGYQSWAGDLVVETKEIINSNMEIRSSFLDIFFELPGPQAYINNNPEPGISETIFIQLVGQASCAGTSCTEITVFTSGKVDITN